MLIELPRKYRDGAKLLTEHLSAWDAAQISYNREDVLVLVKKYDAPKPVFKDNGNEIIAWITE